MAVAAQGKNDRQVSVVVVGVSRTPETFLVRLIYGLADAGIRVTVACERKKDWRPHPNLELLNAPGWNNDWATRLSAVASNLPHALARGRKDMRRLGASARDVLKSKLAVERAYRMLPFAGRRWDVIYFPWNSAAIIYEPLFDLGPAVISCRGGQINVSPHDSAQEWIRQGLERTFARASAVHCVSEAIQREALRYGLHEQKAFINRPAVNIDFFRPAEERPAGNVFRIITVGSITWRKAHEHALLALHKLRDRGIPAELEIVGGGPDRQRIVFATQDLDLQEHVRLPGALAPAAVRDRLQASDAFLLSSMSEGISNAVLEAMACGLPVVTTACGGMEEVITNGVEGFVVPVRDPDAMAGKLAMLWADQQLRARMAAAARDRICRELTLDRQVAKFVSVFQQISRREDHAAFFPSAGHHRPA